MFDDFEIEDSDQELDITITNHILDIDSFNNMELSVEYDLSTDHTLVGLEEQPYIRPFDNSKSEAFNCETSSDRCNEPNACDTDIDDLASIRDELDKELNGSTKGQNISFGTAFCWNFCRAGTDAGNARYHVQHGC